VALGSAGVAATPPTLDGTAAGGGSRGPTGVATAAEIKAEKKKRANGICMDVGNIKGRVEVLERTGTLA